MKEQLISFETAKLAKEKGFDWSTDNHYSYDGIGEYNEYTDDLKNSEHIFNEYTAPTQSLLQKWLREEHKIVVQVTLFPDEGYIGDVIKLSNTQVIEFSTSGDDNYETALEKVIQEALKLI